MPDDLLADGSTTFLGGQDASKVPHLVPPESYFAGVNISVQNGVPIPRWGVHRKKLNFPDSGIVQPDGKTLTYREIFHSGRFQAAAPYSIGGTYYVLVVINGLIFLIDQDTYDVSVLSITDGSTLNGNAARINWSPAGAYMVLFDFPNVPVILQGSTARRAVLTDFEVPISVLGAYNQNRLFIANAANEFTGGDPAGNLATPNAPITFEEIEAVGSPYLGQIFQLSTNYNNDPITAMGFLQVTDTSTGIGPLLVATNKAIYSYQTQNPRSTWEAGQFGSVFIEGAGIAGARAFSNVNSDLFFLSSDGQVRTAAMSREEQKKWARIPVSKEVQNWLKYWDKSLISYGVVGYFQNKLFVTANPYRTNALNSERNPIYDVTHGGIVVLELDNLATIKRDGVPAWAGLWTGVRPLDFVTNNDRFFVMSKDEEFSNQLYEFDPATTYDTADGLVRQVRAIIYTREFDFENHFQNKSAHSLDVAIANVQGDLSLDVKFKPAHGSRFVEWQTFTHLAPWRSCSGPTSCSINGLLPHNFRDLNFGEPKDGKVCDAVSNLYYDTFRKLQLKIIIEGTYWELEGFKIKAKPLPQNEFITACAVYNPVELCGECSDDWSFGAFKSCLSLAT